MVRGFQVWIGLGILGLLFTLLSVVVGIDYYIGHGPDDYTEEEMIETGETFLFICTPSTMIPSILFLAYGLSERRKFQKLQDVADILKAYRRIKISELAQKINKTEMESEKMILECIEKELVQGYMDRMAGAFFTNDFLHQVRDAKHGWKCPACGAYNDKVVLPGEIAKCAYCRRVQAPENHQNVVPSPPQHQMTTLQPNQCRWCGTPLVFVSQYNRWFCGTCNRYV